VSNLWLYNYCSKESDKDIKEMKQIISLDLYYTDFVTKKDRRIQYATDFTEEINNNSIILLDKINHLLNELGIDKGDVTSGWRPPSINAKTANAAKRSAHMMGKAVDLLDNHNQDLAKLIGSRPDLLRKYDLFMEDMNSTRGQNTNWCHLDYMARSDRPSRIFIP